MKRRFKLKINGESPRSLFLACVLGRFKCDIYLYDFSLNSNSKKDNQIFLFSNSSKNLLSKFNFWNEIEDISYGFTSLNIIDNLVSEQLLLRTEDFSKKYLNTFGWTASYSDIKSLLVNKLINLDNVHFISKKQLIDECMTFDYEFNFKSYSKISKLSKFLFSTFKRKNDQILIFNVYLRGHIEKRLYEINTSKGLIILTPINKNLYQIIWNNVSSKITETALNSKSLFLDNLSTLLPNELIIDQIVGDINFLNVGNNSSSYIIKNKSICFNENKFTSNILLNLHFDFIINNLLEICYFLEKIDPKNIKILNNLGFLYLYRKYIELKIKFTFSNLFINLFTLNNIFCLSLRKLLFILLKRVNLLKIIFIRNIITLNIKNKSFK